MPKSRRMMRALGLLATFPAALAWTAPKLLPNASFEQGDGQPTGWSLKGGGAWGSDDAVEGKRFVTDKQGRRAVAERPDRVRAGRGVRTALPLPVSASSSVAERERGGRAGLLDPGRRA